MNEDDAKPVYICKWDVGSLKLALDDAAKEILTKKYELKENFKLFDGRLIICTLSIIVAGFCLLYDYFYPHPLSRNVMIISVVLYFFLSLILTLYVMYVEKNIIFIGMMEDKTGLDPSDTWTVSSNMNKYDPIYHLNLSTKSGISDKVKTASVDKCASEFFSSKGELDRDVYARFLENFVSVLMNKKE